LPYSYHNKDHNSLILELADSIMQKKYKQIVKLILINTEQIDNI